MLGGRRSLPVAGGLGAVPGQLRPPLIGVDVEWTEVWDDFTAAMSDAEAGVYFTPDYTLDDSIRLREVVGAAVGGPFYVIVTPLSLGRLQLLREMDRSRFQVVWAKEVANRLLIGLQRAGWRVKCTWRPTHCAVTGQPTFHSAAAPKDFLMWAVLLRAVAAAQTKSWRRICSEDKVARRTLERLALRKIGCTLQLAAQDPERVKSAFATWVAERSSANGTAARVERLQ